MNFDSSQPIWLQLLTEFSRRIVVGQWAAGSQIPAVRDLAVELGVNPNTVQRSLSQLEVRGLCRVERGAGRFVTDNQDEIEKARKTLAVAATKEFISAAQGLHMDMAAATDLVQEHWEER